MSLDKELLASVLKPQNIAGAVSNFAISYLPQNSTKLPKQRILSSSATIELLDDKGELVFEIELDSFSAKKEFRVVKRWIPFGRKTEEVLLENIGWDISFKCSKTDWRLSLLAYLQEVSLIGEDTESNVPVHEFFGSLYNAPTFEFKQKFSYQFDTDTVVEIYRFKDVKLLSFGQDLSEDNVEIPEEFQAFATRRILDDSSILPITIPTPLPSLIRDIIVRQKKKKPIIAIPDPKKN